MPDNTGHHQMSFLPRRRVLIAIGGGLAGMTLAGCNAGGRSKDRGANGSSAGTGTPGDFSARFAAYQPAIEPDADPSKVVWPEFVLQAGPEVQRLYEFALVNGELLRYMPCFCGCGASGHRNNRDCYVKAVNPDGSVVFDDMAPT